MNYVGVDFSREKADFQQKKKKKMYDGQFMYAFTIADPPPIAVPYHPPGANKINCAAINIKHTRAFSTIDLGRLRRFRATAWRYETRYFYRGAKARRRVFDWLKGMRVWCRGGERPADGRTLREEKREKQRVWQSFAPQGTMMY